MLFEPLLERKFLLGYGHDHLDALGQGTALEDDQRQPSQGCATINPIQHTTKGSYVPIKKKSGGRLRSYTSYQIILGAVLPLLFVSTAAAAVYPKQAFDWDQIEFVYAFGDSYSFVPGTFGLPSFSFIGDATRLAFTPEQLLSNRIIPNKTSSGGQNWLEYLTGCFGGLPASCPKQLWDFAHGGATIDASLLLPRRNTTVQLVDQVRQWKDYAADILPRPVGKTLTAWWIGINDSGRVADNDTITDPDVFLDADIEAYFRVVKTAANNGLRAHLFLNVPPVDKSPFAQTIRTGPQGLKAAVDQFNEKLAVRVAKYARDNPGKSVYDQQLVLTFDAASTFTDILENPSRFGLNDTTTFCPTCDNQAKFFWHNAQHPTERVHQILARQVEEYLRSSLASFRRISYVLSTPGA